MSYLATVVGCLVIVGIGAYIGYAVGGHEPIGVFVGAAVALVLEGIVAIAVNALVRRRGGRPVVGAPTDSVLGQGRRTGYRDPDAS